jgi:hypothetical protein
LGERELHRNREAENRIVKWFLSVVMALNQLGNALTGGDANMTMSARAGYARRDGSKFGKGMCHVLDWLDKRDGDAPEGDHCDLAMKHDVKRHVGWRDR